MAYSVTPSCTSIRSSPDEGYAVMYINPWGSGGYTEDFQADLPGHYGEQDYADIMEAVDYCVKNIRVGWTVSVSPALAAATVDS